MDEFESKLTDLLRRAGSSAEGSPTGLLRGARQRVRRRRIRGLTGLALTVAATAGVTAGVPLVFDRTADGTADPPPSADGGRTFEVSSTDWVPDGWRVESWRDVTWAVPDRWGYGNVSQWCIQDHPGRPQLQRPLGASTLVGCGPSLGYGMVVSPRPGGSTDPRDHQPGASVSERVVSAAHLLVTTRSAALTARILGTARVFRDHDANGCPSRLPVPTRGHAEDPETSMWNLRASDRFSVCRYSSRVDGPNLEQSELLTLEQSQAAYRALRAAPTGRGPDAPVSQCIDWPEEQAVAVVHGTDVVAWVHYDGCRGHRVDLGGQPRKLTSEVMYWAMSPGLSGGFDGTIPMPSRPRTLPADANTGR